MESITLFTPKLYSTVNIIIVFCMCILAYWNYANMHNSTLIHTDNGSMIMPQIYMWLFIIFIGLRPLSGVFSDMRMYSWTLDRILSLPSLNAAVADSGEWLWSAYTYIVGSIGGVHLMFFCTTVLYVLCSYIAICRFFKYRRDVALLFLFGFFSFFAYATNTIRAGLAMSIVLIALSYFVDVQNRNPRSMLLGVALCMAAFGIHNSSLLPIGALILAMFVLRNPKTNFKIWLGCIALSLILGSGLQDLIMDFIMASDFDDDRVANYLGQEAGSDVFLRTGFRWDFIIFSSLPILVGMYVLANNQSPNKKYHLLLNTYIIANMFWVCVNRASYSDRFAYLSWFLYPIVMAYPFLHINIKHGQARLMSRLLLLVSGFTFLMHFLYYD